jgi:GxxExxY protein
MRSNNYETAKYAKHAKKREGRKPLSARLWRRYTCVHGRGDCVQRRELQDHRGVLRRLHGERCGFLEAVYQECVEIEFRLQGIPFVAQKPLALEYKGTPLRSVYQPDFICYDKIVLELKAVTDLANEHRAQVQNYLKATGLQLGILANFGHYAKIQIERIVNTRGRYSHGS